MNQHSSWLPLSFLCKIMVKCSMCTTTDYRQNVLKFNGLLDYKLLYLTTKCPIVTVERAMAMRKNSALSRVLPRKTFANLQNRIPEILPQAVRMRHVNLTRLVSPQRTSFLMPRYRAASTILTPLLPELSCLNKFITKPRRVAVALLSR